MPTNTIGSISEKAYQAVKKLNPTPIFEELFALKYKKGMV
jgi:hypothetical protein